MSTLLESYKILGVQVGAGMADVTTSYRQLCREHHPDISDDPGAEELMKEINLAYTVLREKFRRESTFRERQQYTRPIRRYPSAPAEPRQPPKETQRPAAEAREQAAKAQRQRAAERAAVSAEAEKEARSVLHGYFEAINTFDYVKAYKYLSAHDRSNILLESFIGWRESVARLYPMRAFRIAGGSSVAVITWGDDTVFHARKFRVIITEDAYSDNVTQSGDIDKLVINENGEWRVFLGYREVSELTRTFDKRFETRKQRDIARRWQEYTAGLHPEYDMLNMKGMRKAVSKELYRQRRYGGAMTFAAISIKYSGAKDAGKEEMLRSAAKTICGALRETDVPAYAGDGVFVIMFAELGKKNANNIISRLTEYIRKNAGSQLGKNADIDYTYGSWSGNSYADMDRINEILSKTGKKI